MMRAATILVAALLAVIVRSETPDHVTSKLRIRIPQDLDKPEGYDHREALFGTPPYGGTITQNVYYADDTLCDTEVDTSKGYPARDFERPGKMKPWPTPFILMVDRGDCTFVQKTRHAQSAGAAAVLIADDKCLCSDTDCVGKYGALDCEDSEPIMANDGSGDDISIPAFLMFKHDADALKDLLKQDHPAQVEMSWKLPNPDGRVEYDLWTNPTDVVSRDFQENFKSLALALGKDAYFTPHMYIYDGYASGCIGPGNSNQCSTLCTNNGRYCATDPDNDLDRGISGADVVVESLRRMCIWDTYGKEDGIGEKWWLYIEKFHDRCMSEAFFKNDRCIADAFKHAKINGETIDRCMRNSGATDSDVDNVILKEQIDQKRDSGVVVLPTAFVNNAAIRGLLSVGNVFGAICAGYAAGTVPPVCKQCADCGDPVECVQSKGVCKTGARAGQPTGGVSSTTFVLSMMLLTGLFGGVGFWYYKKTRDDMKDHVRGILAEYMPLEDQGEGPITSPMDFAQTGGTASLIS